MIRLPQINDVVSLNGTPFLIGVATSALCFYLVSIVKALQLPKTIDLIHLTSNGTTIQEFSSKNWKSYISVNQLNELRKSIGWKERTEHIWQEIFTKSSHIVCVKKEERLIGFGSFVGNGRMGSIFDICVHSLYQKQKVGTQIMNRIITKIQKQDYASIGLFGWASNPTVLEFYKKFQFEENKFGLEASASDLRTI